MEKTFNIYKGLQKPLVYRGFAGKFIYWGIASLLAGLVFGALAIALLNMLLGVVVMAGCIGGGLMYTASQQKKGLHQKNRAAGIYHFPSKINPKVYAKTKRIPDALYRH